MLYCMGCHGAQAQGVPGQDSAAGRTRWRATCARPRDATTCCAFPGAANSVLSDAQLAAVLNWLATTYAAGR